MYLGDNMFNSITRLIALATIYAGLSSLGALLYAGQPATTQPTADGNGSWGQTIDGLKLKVTVAKTRYAPLEPIRCEIQIQNTGSAKILLSRKAGVLGDYQFDIRSADGTEMPLTVYGQQQKLVSSLGATVLADLVPGQIWSDDVEMLNRMFDMTQSGTYSIVIKKHISYLSQSKENIDLQTNKLTLVIIDN